MIVETQNFASLPIGISKKRSRWNNDSVFQIIFTKHYLMIVSDPLKVTVFAFPLYWNE